MHNQSRSTPASSVPSGIDGTIAGPVGLQVWNGAGQEIDSELEAVQRNFIALALSVE